MTGSPAPARARRRSGRAQRVTPALTPRVLVGDAAVGVRESRPDGSSFDIGIEFTFEAQDGRTLMTMIQTGFPTADLRDEHGHGLPNAFARLERAIHPRT